MLYSESEKRQSLRNFENAKKRLAESEFWHELYVAFRKQKKDNRSKLSKMQKKAVAGVVLTKTLCSFPKVKKQQSLRNFEKAKKKRANSLELVHCEFFGRFTPGARFFLFYYE